jgi:hypothetical protein
MIKDTPDENKVHLSEFSQRLALKLVAWKKESIYASID